MGFNEGNSYNSIILSKKVKEYIMREITSPKSYGIAEEISFIAGDGQKVVMQDMPIPETTKTGDERIYNFMGNITGTSTTTLLLSISI